MVENNNLNRHHLKSSPQLFFDSLGGTQRRVRRVSIDVQPPFRHLPEFTPSIENSMTNSSTGETRALRLACSDPQVLGRWTPKYGIIVPSFFQRLRVTPGRSRSAEVDRRRRGWDGNMANGYSGLSSVKGKFWLSCIIIVSLSERGTSLSSSIPTVVDHYVSVDTNSSVFTVDGKFLSVAIDSNVLRDHWSALNFSSERMLNLAKGLSPSYVRFGGTAEDFLYYDRSNTRPNADGAQKTVRVVEYLNFFKEEHNFTITSKDLDKIHLLAQDAGWHVLFGLNVLFRGRDGAWNPSNAKMIIDYVTANGYQFGWELGNGTLSVFSVFEIVFKWRSFLWYSQYCAKSFEWRTL